MKVSYKRLWKLLIDKDMKKKDLVKVAHISTYMEHEYVSAALRTARDLDAGEEEWQKFIDDLKKRRG